MNAVESIDPRIEKVLLKLRKKATSALSAKAISDAIELLGYTVEKGKAWREASKFGFGRKSKALTKNKILWNDSGPDRIRLFETEYSRKDDAEANFEFHEFDHDGMEPNESIGLEEVAVLHNSLSSLLADELPANAVTDKVVTLAIGKIETKVDTDKPTK